ncbi:uncharacterized protein LOC112694374 [Sipha flava]|uniref:Uncharacterized protein LOC112694374 n=1 Tax=Sipha flava TaxID=143950 RepID=A0A8B8GR83_9HEMI|nr:uncharacterized protein LOC112694374 [Sipha flava]
MSHLESSVECLYGHGNESEEEAENLEIMENVAKNEFGEFFSSLVKNLSENDVIVIVNGIVSNKNNYYRVYVQPENNSSVFLFKLNSLSSETNLFPNENLSKISGTGIYSIFGYVRQTAISDYKECMWLRIKCFDKSLINILIYPFAVHDNRKLKNFEKSSNQVDILVENPCDNFMSLVFDQKILLRNVKVNRVDNSDCFLLCVQGITDNLKISVYPIHLQTVMQNYYVPVIINVHPILRKKELVKELIVLKKISQINQEKFIELKKFTPNVDGMYFFLSSNNLDAFDSNISNPGPHLQILHLNYLKEEKSLRGCAIRCIGPCRPINIEPNLILDDNDSSDFLSGYCDNCFSFTPKSYLIPCKILSNEEYKCSKCYNFVYLHFFFNLYFLYGKNETQAIKISCYSKTAERILKKLSKKNIKLEDYLLNYNCRKLVLNTMRKFMLKKTKVNLIVLNSPLDNTFVLVSLSTKNIMNN